MAFGLFRATGFLSAPLKSKESHIIYFFRHPIVHFNIQRSMFQMWKYNRLNRSLRAPVQEDTGTADAVPVLNFVLSLSAADMQGMKRFSASKTRSGSITGKSDSFDILHRKSEGNLYVYEKKSERIQSP